MVRMEQMDAAEVSRLEEETNDRVRTMASEVPGLREALGDPGRVDRFLERMTADSIQWRGKKIHLEIFEAVQPRAAIVFHPGVGIYSRFYLCALALLSERGFACIGVDRPGHGFSHGKRGDCTVEDIVEVTQAVVDLASERYGAPVLTAGSSWGGITNFATLPALRGVCAAVCHDLFTPGIPLYPSRRLETALVRMLNRAAPGLGVPMGVLMPPKVMAALSESPIMVDWLVHYRRDRLMCPWLTVRSVYSYVLGYKAPRPYREIDFPVLALIGEKEQMLPKKRMKAQFERAAIPAGEWIEIPDAGHLLFHDHLIQALDAVETWLERVLY